ncbi:MAG TPA: choice-of-anchor D domain-containing protein, partial [Luteolibacter sp.]
TGTAPEIAVQQPLGTDIPDAGSKSYGSVLVGSSKSLSYTIKNSGNGNLTGIAITKSGTHAADFTVTTAPAATVAPGGSTLFVLKFTPGGTGSRSAVIQIGNNDSDEKPFDITVTGTGTASTATGSIVSMDTASGLLATTPDDTSKTVITVNPGDGLKYLTLEVMKAPGTAEQRRVVEVSSNLVDWYSGSNYTTVLRDDASVLIVRDNTPYTSGTKRYIRLRQSK